MSRIVTQDESIQREEGSTTSSGAELADNAISPESLRVLVVDDERMMRELLTMSLRRLGYRVEAVDNGMQALKILSAESYDLLLLDVMMPGMDGFAVCTEVRKRSDIPIVMLTALSRPDDVVRGLEVGADNYITKPFTFKEVEARIQAIVRRSVLASERNAFTIMEHGDICINDEHNEVTINTQPVELTRTEYQLLHYMVIHAEELVSKEDLLQSVWGYEDGGNTNLVELAVGRLRKKIEENPAQPKRLVTVRGFGYKLVHAESSQNDSNLINHRAFSQ